MRALDEIRVAVLTRRITHGEGASAAKTCDSWVKAYSAQLTKSLVNELQAELDAKANEIEELRTELSKASRLRAG